MVKMELRQLKKAIQQLSVREKNLLLQELQRDTLQEQFKQMFSRIDARLKKNPISQKELDKIVEGSREEFHARSRH